MLVYASHQPFQLYLKVSMVLQVVNDPKYWKKNPKICVLVIKNLKHTKCTCVYNNATTD